MVSYYGHFKSVLGSSTGRHLFLKLASYPGTEEWQSEPGVAAMHPPDFGDEIPVVSLKTIGQIVSCSKSAPLSSFSACIYAVKSFHSF
ncbi:hypothetical protein AVEN_125798-1 [Araneus ventricosus]|uniref:Uncharacterized protein n=1 Tax=Araneus ventricosus TaxID=182803 RepID=A0A4Y2KVT2_ARAVE|nr:hypothetical protein AVEN_125798-1 [Araneus ventricosus]